MTEQAKTMNEAISNTFIAYFNREISRNDAVDCIAEEQQAGFEVAEATLCELEEHFMTDSAVVDARSNPTHKNVLA